MSDYLKIIGDNKIITQLYDTFINQNKRNKRKLI